MKFPNFESDQHVEIAVVVEIVVAETMLGFARFSSIAEQQNKQTDQFWKSIHLLHHQHPKHLMLQLLKKCDAKN